MKFTGKVTKVIDKSGTSKDGKPFTLFHYKIEESGDIRFPQSGLFEAFGDRIPLLTEGQEVEVWFGMECSEYQGKLYGRNAMWKVQVINDIYRTEESTMDEPMSVSPQMQATERPKGGLPF